MEVLFRKGATLRLLGLLHGITIIPKMHSLVRIKLTMAGGQVFKYSFP